MRLIGSQPAISRRQLLLLASAAGTAAALPVRRPRPAFAGLQESGQAFSGPVEIGGRSLWIDRRGNGEPTVVLEAGFGNNGQIWNTIALEPDSGKEAVLPATAEFAQVIAYDRPGTVVDANHRSRSDPAPMPRTAEDVVADLHALLLAADAPGPYVLVGHSFGGIVVRLYAATYPDDVVGMVLVEAADEGLNDRLRASMSADQWAEYQRLNAAVPDELADYPERETIDQDVSFAQLEAATAHEPLPQMPLVVISRGIPVLAPDASPEELGLPADFPIDVIEPAWQAGQANLAALLPDANHVIATRSSHYVQLDEPHLVVDAIRRVIAAVHDPSAWSV